MQQNPSGPELVLTWEQVKSTSPDAADPGLIYELGKEDYNIHLLRFRGFKI